MKVALGSRALDGPWGGGNRFVAALAGALEAGGHSVVYDLDHDNIDIVLLTEPRVRSPNVGFGAGKILRYLALRNPNAVVIHRVNECDERKGTKLMNKRLALANYAADVTVFVGTWLTELPVWVSSMHTPWRAILNGADTEIFNQNGFEAWDGEGPLKLVTHHWGANEMKGFDVYRHVDALLGQDKWRGRLEFTYVGNLPAGFSFKNVNYVKPLDGKPLADQLRRNHAYLTASINEPGGNHQNEGALCGLPLVYRGSGCMPEYCEGYGLQFAGPADIESVLEQLMQDYENLTSKMTHYPHTANKMAREWIALFGELINQRETYSSSRRLWRNPLIFAANQIPF